jgi:hypothetical protein
MYIFGLCFMQLISGYVMETEASQVDPATLEAIEMYWSSVPQATVTLYLAITGGADWEPLATPVRAAGEFYFFLFMFYIAFTAFAVLNVLTGMYVDTATNIAKSDEESVGAELLERGETTRFREFFQGKHTGSDCSGYYICWDVLENYLEHPVVEDLLQLFEIEIPDMERVFKTLDCEHANRVECEQFIKGLISAKMSGVGGIEMVTLVTETRRYVHQQAILMEYIQDRFDQVNKMLRGGKVEPVIPLDKRLIDDKCLPIRWQRKLDLDMLSY